MDTETGDEKVRVTRARDVADAVHNAALANAQVSDPTRADMARYADGDLTVDELVQRTRNRYNLPRHRGARRP